MAQANGQNAVAAPRVPMDQPGVPLHMQGVRATRWLVTVRCCRMSRCALPCDQLPQAAPLCYLCRHRRHHLAPQMSALARRMPHAWSICSRCDMAVPPCSLVPCSNRRCDYTFCAMCAMLQIQESYSLDINRAIGRVKCPECNTPRPWAYLYITHRSFLTHRSQIRQHLRRMWTGPGL